MNRSLAARVGRIKNHRPQNTSTEEKRRGVSIAEENDAPLSGSAAISALWANTGYFPLHLVHVNWTKSHAIGWINDYWSRVVDVNVVGKIWCKKAFKAQRSQEKPVPCIHQGHEASNSDLLPRRFSGALPFSFFFSFVVLRCRTRLSLSFL